jgi:uridine monophosphate synthetase
MGLLFPVSRAIADAPDPAAAAAALVERMRTAVANPAPVPTGGLAEALFDAGCIRFGEFALKSGIVSPIYLDLRTLTGHPTLLRRVARSYASLLGDSDRIAGVPLGGLPLATAVALESGRPMVYPRPPKDHGTGASVEGPFETGESVVVVDDVITSGISALAATVQLEAAGLVIDRAVVLVDRRGGGREALAARGIELHAVLDLVDVVGDLVVSGRITAQQHERVLEFLGA